MRFPGNLICYYTHVNFTSEIFQIPKVVIEAAFSLSFHRLSVAAVHEGFRPPFICKFYPRGRVALARISFELDSSPGNSVIFRFHIQSNLKHIHFLTRFQVTIFRMHGKHIFKKHRNFKVSGARKLWRKFQSMHCVTILRNKKNSINERIIYKRTFGRKDFENEKLTLLGVV